MLKYLDIYTNFHSVLNDCCLLAKLYITPPTSNNVHEKPNNSPPKTIFYINYMYKKVI